MTHQIKATIVADSVSSVNGQRITTFELEYPRWIHGEILTHRLFSRNAMSSRAVPIEKMLSYVRYEPALPVHWGINQPGMQAKAELQGDEKKVVADLWQEAAQGAAYFASLLSDKGLHKQVVNRILEPFQLMKTVLTATEFDNFFWLRCHEDAQPEIKDLADKMYKAMSESKEQSRTAYLEPGEWHTPYYANGSWKHDYDMEYYGTPLEDALAISSSCCAQVSYRLLDDSLEKARKVYQRLVESTPVHASPFEHCASPMKTVEWPEYCDPSVWLDVEEKGVTHADREGKYWSGNFKSWIQYRQLISGNVCNKFEEK